MTNGKTREMVATMVWLGQAGNRHQFQLWESSGIGFSGLSNQVPKGVEDLWMTLGG